MPGAISMAYYRPGRGAADLDPARGRAADRAHARAPRRRVARGGDPRPVRRLGGAVGVAARRARARSCATAPGGGRGGARGRLQHARVGDAHAGLPDPRRDVPPLLRAGPRGARQATARGRRTGCRRSCTRSSTARRSAPSTSTRSGAAAGAPTPRPGSTRCSPASPARTTRARAPTSATTRPRTTARSSRPTRSTHAAGGSTLDALTFMRGIGALFAMVTVLALLAMLRELFPDRPLLTGAVALICALPAGVHVDLGRRQSGRRADPDRRRAVLAVRARAAPRADRAHRGGHRACRRARRADQARRRSGSCRAPRSASCCCCGSARRRAGGARRSRRRPASGSRR